MDTSSADRKPISGKKFVYCWPSPHISQKAAPLSFCRFTCAKWCSLLGIPSCICFALGLSYSGIWLGSTGLPGSFGNVGDIVKQTSAGTEISFVSCCQWLKWCLTGWQAPRIFSRTLVRFVNSCRDCWKYVSQGLWRFPCVYPNYVF